MASTPRKRHLILFLILFYPILNEHVKETGGIDFDMPYGLICSGNDKTKIEKYREDSAYLFEGRIPEIYPLGCTIGTHIGPGAVGIAYFVK